MDINQDELLFGGFVPISTAELSEEEFQLQDALDTKKILHMSIVRDKEHSYSHTLEDILTFLSSLL